MLRRLTHELVLSLVAILAITGWYVWFARGTLPQPGGLVGHSLGIVGFALMLAAETLYTLRKRLRRFACGSMHTWLRLHIVAGLVGPYLVLLHTAGKFHGLAGVVTLLTVVMVLSGFVGRYLYTAAPRTLEGVELTVQELEFQIAWTDRQLQEIRQGLPPTAMPAIRAEAPPGGWRTVLERPLLRWNEKRRLRKALLNQPGLGSAQEARLKELMALRYNLLLQVNSLAAARRLLALWHLFHIPLGAVLFTLAFLHVGAALYYSTYLK